MGVRKKRCIICGAKFIARHNIKDRQLCCGKPECGRKNKANKDKSWRKKHTDYDKSRKLKIRAWAAKYPNYWRLYRHNNPEYRLRDNQRRRRKHKMVKNAAKQAKYYRRVDKLIDYLVWKERAAKQDELAIGLSDVP